MVVVNLQMPRRQKVAVASLFLIAVIADIASILKIYYASIQIKSGDTWDLYSAGLSETFEMGLGQLCVSIPTLRPLLSKFVGKFGYSSNDRSATNYSYGNGIRRPRDALIEDGVYGSDEPWTQLSRIHADLDSSKSLDDEKLPGIKVMYTLEMGSMDRATGMHEETTRDSETALHDQVITRH